MGSTLEIQDDYLKSSKIKYLDSTNKLNNYNEIYNLNNHLLSTHNQELDSLVTANNQIKTKLMKMKQDYLLQEYAIHEYNMYSNILSFSILIACVAIFFVARATVENQRKLIYICGGLAVFYLIVVFIVLASNINRRKYAWNQWYWNPM